MKLDPNEMKGLEQAIDAKVSKAARGRSSQVLAEVTRVESDGTTWVHVFGGSDETPVRLMSSEAKPGDVITITLTGLSALGIGNMSSPAATARMLNTRAASIEQIVEALRGQQVEFESVTTEELTAQHAYIQDLEADTAKIHELTADQISASVAYIDDLTAGDVTAESITAAKGVFDKIEAGDITAASIEAATGYIADLTSKNITTDNIDAATGYIADLTSENITTQDIQSATGYIGSLVSDSIGAGDIAAATGFVGTLTANEVTAADLTADHATVGSLDANYAHLTNGVIDNATIGYASVNGLNANYAHVTNGIIDTATIGHASVNGLQANYAQVDAANINTATIREGWLDKVMVQSGLIAHEGVVYELDALQVNASKIKAGTLDVERLVVTQNGHKYLVHVNAQGTPSYEKLDGDIVADNTIVADKLVAGTITAREITTENLVGTGGWINLRNGTFSYQNATSGDGISWDGTTLTINSQAMNARFENIKVGARNLLRNSGKLDKWTKAAAATVADGVWTASESGNTANVNRQARYWVGTGVLADYIGKTMVISFDIMSPDWSAVVETSANAGLGGLAIQLEKVPGTPYGSSIGSMGRYAFSRLSSTSTTIKWNNPELVDGKWIRMESEPFVLDESVWTSGTETAGTDYLAFDFLLRRNGTVSFRKPKIEIGTICTDWTPAPEDAEGEIATITYNYNEISDTVDSHTQAIGRVESARSMRLTLLRNNNVDSWWNTYTVGNSTTWQNKNYYAVGSSADTGFDATTLKVGDLVLIQGTATDTGSLHSLTAKVTSVPTSATGTIPLEIVSTSDTTALAGRVTAAETSISQNADAIALRATKGEVYEYAQPNLTPMFSSHNPDGTYPNGGVGGYWQPSSDKAYNRSFFTAMEDGWIHVEAANTAQKEFVPPRVDWLEPGDKVTMLVEWRNASYTGTGGNFYTRNYGNNVQLNANWYPGDMAEESGEARNVFTVNSTATGEAAWNGLVIWTFTAKSSSTWTGDVRISFYFGEYMGPYKPYSGTQLYASQAELKVANDEISTKVSKNGVISAIEQTPETIKISASKVNIEGATIFTSGRLSEAALDGEYKGYADGMSLKTHNAAAYLAYEFDLPSPIEAGVPYILRLWDVDVAQSAKEAADLGIGVYYCGGSVRLGAFLGTGYFTNGHADYLEMRFTAYADKVADTSAGTSSNNLSHSTVTEANPKTIRFYNSPSDVSGTRNMSVGRWTLERAFDVGATNLVRNGNFAADKAYWSITAAANITGTVEADSAHVRCLKLVQSTAGAPSGTEARVYPNATSSFTHVTGQTYSLSFYAKASAAGTLYVGVGGTGMEVMRKSVGTSWARYTATYTADRAGSLTFFLVAAGTWYIADVMLVSGEKPMDFSPGPRDVVARTQRVYYRKTASGAPSAPTEWVTATAAAWGSWTTRPSSLTNTSGTKYPYLYTCMQTQFGDGTIVCSSVLLDDTTTVIDGGNIITGTVTANALNATDINASNKLTIGALTTDLGTQITNGASAYSRATASRGTCATEAATAAKVVTSAGFELVAGAAVTVYNSAANTVAGKLTLNVNSKGAKDVYVGADPTSDTNRLLWNTGTTITYVYDGSHFVVDSNPGAWYGTACTAAEGTAAKTTSGRFVVFKGASISVPMNNANTAAAPTLNPGALGASNIYFGSGTTVPTKANGYSWTAGSVVIFTFDGKFWRFGNQTFIDGGNILTKSIAADKIAANSLTVGQFNSDVKTSLSNGDSALTKVNYHNRSCRVGNSSNTQTTYWRKFASASITGKDYDTTIQFTVQGTGNMDNRKNDGTLRAHLRTSSTVGSFGSAQLQWVKRASGIVLSDFVLAYKATSGTKVDIELWARCPNSWQGFQFYVDFEASRIDEEDDKWTLHDSWTANGSSAITSGFTQVASTDIDAARDVAETYITAIDANGIKVHASSNPTTNYAQINASGMNIFADVDGTSTSLAAFGKGTARVGISGRQRVQLTDTAVDLYTPGNNVGARVNASGLTVYNYNTSTSTNDSVAAFGATSRIGKSNAQRVTITSSAVDIYDSNNKLSQRIEPGGTHFYDAGKLLMSLEANSDVPTIAFEGDVNKSITGGHDSGPGDYIAIGAYGVNNNRNAEIQIDAYGKDGHSYLWLTDNKAEISGTDIVFRTGGNDGFYMSGTNLYVDCGADLNRPILKVLNGNANGSGVSLGGGAQVLIGSGESYIQMEADFPTHTEEQLRLGSDNSIYFHPNYNTSGAKRTWELNASMLHKHASLDYTSDTNGVTANQNTYFGLLDQNGKYVAWLTTQGTAGGGSYCSINARHNVNGTEVTNTLTVGVTKDGTRTVSVSDAGVWRTALSAAAASHAHAAGDVTSGTFDAARIPNLNTSKLTAGTLGVARGGTGKTSGEFYGATRIYSSTATCATFTLTSSVANFTWLTIQYKGNDGFYTTTNVFNNKAALDVALSVAESTANGAVNIKRVTYTFSGTSATVKTYGEVDMTSTGVTTSSSKHVTVTGVWGWV